MLLDTLVEKVVVSPLITINHKESIATAAEMINIKKIRKTAVTKKSEIVEILTSTNLVRQLIK